MSIKMPRSRLLAPLFAVSLLVGPGFAAVSLASPADSGSPAGTPTSGASNPRGQLLLESDVLGAGVMQENDGTMSALFRLRAGPTEKSAHGGNLTWAAQDGSEAYNGAIKSYSVSGASATITGAGPLFKSDGTRVRVQFKLTVTPGEAGQATANLTFTGKNVSMDCQDTVQVGFIALGPLAGGDARAQLKSVKSDMTTLRQDIVTLRGKDGGTAQQPTPAVSPSASPTA
ncbi:MAG TPA: hypothetical protein VMV93_04890 [Chloroflexota bacterium]|nr:hypothetical protein [Chloroflexota bacterium]